MAQILKSEIREKILQSALQVFAKKGYVKCSISDIAKTAGISTGNIYHYFPNKEALFYTALPKELTQLIMETVRKKMAVWSGKPLAQDNELYQEGHERLIDMMLQYKKEIIILFMHAQGTIYETFIEDMSDYFSNLLFDYLTSIGLSHKANNKSFNATVKMIYANMIKSFADLLDSDIDHKTIESSLFLYLEYHIAGIRQLSQSPEVQ